MTDRKQMGQQRDEKGRIIGGTPPAGFNVNPQNRHNGAWKKEETPRYKLEQMMKLSADELGEIVKDKATPLFDIKLATAIRDGDWKILDGMINQVYGSPKQIIEQTNLEPPKPLEDLSNKAD